MRNRLKWIHIVVSSYIYAVIVECFVSMMNSYGSETSTMDTEVFVYKSDFNALNMCNPTTKTDHKNSSHDNHLVYCWWWWCCCWKYKTMWEFQVNFIIITETLSLVLAYIIHKFTSSSLSSSSSAAMNSLWANSSHSCYPNIHTCVCVYICHLIRAIIYETRRSAHYSHAYV